LYSLVGFVRCVLRLRIINTYIKRKEIKTLNNLNWFIGVVAFFVVSIVAFGVGVGFWTIQLKAQTGRLLEMLNVAPELYQTEFTVFQWGMWLATSSFVLVLITWLGLWRQLRREAADLRVAATTGPEKGAGENSRVAG
jgi:hypothetical protein